MLESDLFRANAEVCFWSTWYNIQYFYTHTSGAQNMHFSGTLVHGVEAVKVDAAFRPSATARLRESNLGARGQVECILDAVFPFAGMYNPGFALVPDFPATKPARVPLPQGL